MALGAIGSQQLRFGNGWKIERVALAGARPLPVDAADLGAL
jgi:hypothetical protein